MDALLCNTVDVRKPDIQNPEIQILGCPDFSTKALFTGAQISTEKSS